MQPENNITRYYNMKLSVGIIVKKVIISAAIMLLLDISFIQFNLPLFSKQIEDVQGRPPKLKLSGAILCYASMIFALYWFIIRKGAPIIDAFILGASLNAVYEFTNYTFLTNWRPEIVVMDILWGGILFSTTTYLTNLSYDLIF
jgi:uncharacterized membrane protein